MAPSPRASPGSTRTWNRAPESSARWRSPRPRPSAPWWPPSACPLRAAAFARSSSGCRIWKRGWARGRVRPRATPMSDAIHPSAVIDPRASLAAGASVGAFAVIGPEVTLEAGVSVGHHVVLEGQVVVEAGATVGHGSVIGGMPQDLKFSPGTPSGVRIGPRTVLREYVTVHRASTPGAWTTIGADCLLMAMCHVAHDCRLGDGVIVINYAGITGHCVIDARATIGGHVGMVPFTRIGTHAYVGGFAKVVADVPPFVLVDGMPATARGVNVIGLRRAGVPAEGRRR